MKPRPIFSRSTGDLIGYQLRVYLGDKPDGTKNIAARTWRVDPSMARSKILKELAKQQLVFEETMRLGLEEITEPGEAPMNLREFVRLYLDSSYNLKQKTKDTYESKLKRVESALGDFALKSIEPTDILAFLNSLREEGANQRNGKPLSMKSVREYYVLLKGLFKTAVGWKKLDESPMDAIKIPKTKYSKVKALTEAEATAFYNALMEYAPAKYRAYFLLCLQTGTRRAEAGGLRWSKVDLNRNLIRIESTMQYSPKAGIYEETPKTDSSVRNLRITDTAADALRELEKENNAAKEAFSSEWNREDLVFITVDGTPMHPNTPYTWLKRFQKKHGLAD
ncbi:MAG: site-specific integrase, partial [Oscillospiraceae bacterium]